MKPCQYQQISFKFVVSIEAGKNLNGTPVGLYSVPKCYLFLYYCPVNWKFCSYI